MKHKVFVTRRIPEAGLKLLHDKVELSINPKNQVLTREELLEGVKDKDGILSLLTDKIDKEVMDQTPSLKVIANYAVGYDNIDLPEATKRGIFVTNTPDVLTETVADFTWALFLSCARRIPEADLFSKKGEFVGWDPLLFLGRDVYGKTLGIIGFGRIGQAVARRAIGFSMNVLYYDLMQHEIHQHGSCQGETHTYKAYQGTSQKEAFEKAEFEEILSRSDFISLHVPLTKETYHLIGEKELNMMKPAAFLINTARGPIIDEKALVKALSLKKIAGAALDVFENEPKITEELKVLPNCILAPHIASASLETRAKMAEMAAGNLLAVLDGKLPPNLVNLEVAPGIMKVKG